MVAATLQIPEQCVNQKWPFPYARRQFWATSVDSGGHLQDSPAWS